MIATGGASLGLSFDAEALAWRFGYQSSSNGSSVSGNQDQANRFGSVLTNLADQESVATSDSASSSLLANGDSRTANESLGGNEQSTGWSAFLANLADQKLAATTAAALPSNGSSGAGDVSPSGQGQSTGLNTLLANLTDQKLAATTAGMSSATDTSPGPQEQSTGLSTLLANLTDQKLAATTAGISSAADTSPDPQGQSTGLSTLLANLTDQKLAATTAGISSATDTSPGPQEQSTGLSTLLANLTDQKLAATTAGISSAADASPSVQGQSTGLSTLLANLTDQKPAAPTAAALPANGTSGAADASPGAQGQSTGLSALIGPLGQILAPPSPAPTVADSKSGQFQTNSKVLPPNNRNATYLQQKIALNSSVSSGLDPTAQQSTATLGPSAAMVTPIPSSNTNQSETPSPLSANEQLSAAQASLNQTLSSGAAPQKTESALASSRSSAGLRQQNKLVSATSGPDNTSNAPLNPGMIIPVTPVLIVVDPPPVARSAVSVVPNIAPSDKASTTAAQPSTDTMSSLDLSNSKLPNVTVVSQETHLAMTPTLPPMQQIIDVIRTISNHNEPPSIEGSSTALPIATPSMANKTTQILTIRLEPENLGTVIVKMRLSANSLEINLDASNPHTASMLLKDKSVLSESLQTSNYKVDVITIGNNDIAKPDLQGRGNDPQQLDKNATLDMGLSSSNSGAGSTGQGQGQGQNNPTSDSRRIPDIGPEIFEPRAGSDSANYTRGLFV